jgi:hypothetical protein
LKGSGSEGVVHKRTLEAVTSPALSYSAGEILCSIELTPDQLEVAPPDAINCPECAQRESEIMAATKHLKSQGVDRPFMRASIKELEKLLSQHRSDHAVLGRLREELTYRTTRRAKQLRREVEGVIEGQVPIKKEPRPAQAEDQLGLLDPDG